MTSGMIVFKEIKAPKLNNKAILAELNSELEAISKDILLDFELTTATWKHQVKFERLIGAGPASVDIFVGTDDEIYGYVDQGTKRHMIYPKRAKALRFQGGYAAKTTPGIITSKFSGGASGGVVYAKKVNHPGTKARKFSITIERMWKPKFKRRMEAALKRADKASGNEYRG